MDVSIIVCTYNNHAGSLMDTLHALRALPVSEGRQWEVIVVENNSRDATRAVVEEAKRDWPLLRYEVEVQSRVCPMHAITASPARVARCCPSRVRHPLTRTWLSAKRCSTEWVGLIFAETGKATYWQAVRILSFLSAFLGTME